MKIVLTGDLHLGRTSTRLPDEWRQTCRSVQAWQRLVEAVMDAGADLLLLSGDILDHRNQLWEAMGPLQQGIEKLSTAGVRTLAVSGNHDAGSLPELAAQFPEETFTLLGKNGQWQRETIAQDGRAVLHVDGWSFPGAIVREDPTLHYPFSSGNGLPVLAMVHGDPGVTDSKYAPLNLPRLQTLPVSAWLLGHIHTPSLMENGPWILMPGSPHPLDPGEPGPHHAWICEVSEGKLSLPQPFCPARLQYAELEIPVSPEDIPTPDLIRGKVQQAVDEHPVSAINLFRIRFTGTSEDVDGWLTEIENLTEWSAENFRIEKVIPEIHPALKLEEAAKAGPVPALLADALQAPPPELLERLEELCEGLNRQNEYSGKNLPPFKIADLPLTRVLESTLRKTLGQLT